MYVPKDQVEYISPFSVNIVWFNEPLPIAMIAFGISKFITYLDPS